MGTKTIHQVVPGLAAGDTISDIAWPDDSVTLAGTQTVTGVKTFGRVGFNATTPPAAKSAALTAADAAAAAGGTGATAGAYDTAEHRDAAIALVNNLRTRVTELEAIVVAYGLGTAI